MGRGAWVLGLGLCIVLAGCGSSNPQPHVPPEQDAQTPPPEVETPPVTDGGTPPPASEDPPTDAGTPPPPSALEGAPTLAPAACMPWTGAAPPQRATACEVVAEYEDPSKAFTLQRSRYDSDGHLLEQHSFRADGTLYSVETHTWTDGRETFQRLENRASASWQQTEWAYDSKGRVRERADSDSARSERLVYQYHYGSSDQLESILRLVDGAQDNTTLYEYNPAGQLTSIDSTPSCSRHISLCEQYAYRANGKLRSVSRSGSRFWKQRDNYDMSGRITDSSWSSVDELGDSTRAYDRAGRLTRLWVKQWVGNRGSEAITTSTYDANGLLQLERFAEDAVLRAPPNDPTAPEVFTHTRVTRRITYICGTQLPWLEEWDGNEDGVPDARRTYERDASGRLVREEYSGTPGLDDGPVRRAFRYDCR